MSDALPANEAASLRGLRIVPTADAPDAPPPPPRKRGRPKGYPKTGGRQKGTKNWTSEATKDFFIERGNLLDTLADIIAGRPVLTQPASGPGKAEWRYPPIDLRAKTAVGIYAKCWPDQTELTGKAGSPLFNTASLISDPRDLALAYGHREAARQFLERAGIDPDSEAGQAAIRNYEAAVAVPSTPAQDQGGGRSWATISALD